MDTVRRLTTTGCAAAVVLCAGLILAPFAYRVGSLAAARWRWSRNGGTNYTIVVSQYCNCYITGEYELAVRNGHVVAATLNQTDGRSIALKASAFDHLTVEAALERAVRGLRANWLPNWDRRLIVEFDPTFGYVTRFEMGDRHAAQFYFVYTARDLHLASP